MSEHRYIDLQEVASGVWASISPNDITGSNAGIIDLGNHVLVFDTHMTPTAAEKLRAAAETLTGRSPDWVVNSHSHGDHVFGNQVFEDATIFSTAHTRELIAERIGAQIANVADRVKQMQANLDELHKKLANAENPDARAELEEAIFVTETILGDVPRRRLRLPDVTFRKHLSLYGSKRRAEIILMGNGHSPSDSILWLPDDGIAFVADLLFHGWQPFLQDGNPDEWLQLVDKIVGLNPQIVIPGHGEVTTLAAFDTQSHYITTLQKMAADVVAQGGTVEDAATLRLPDAFSLQDHPHYNVFLNNMRFLIGRAAQ